MAKKNLMIVESPAKAKTIEKYLGGDFVVKASYGHVRDLPKGDGAIDIEHGFEPTYVVLPDKKDVIKELKKLTAEAENVWLATDEDREGEAISWHLAEVLGLDLKTTKRVVFNEITKRAVENAVSHPRHVNVDLVNAQQARRVLDRLVGFQISPILWRKVRTGLSAGRVQSVAVRLVVEREREIMDFVSSATYKVSAEFDLGEGSVLKAVLSAKMEKEEDVLEFLEKCKGASFTINNLETKPGKKSPAAPFTTSTLQQEASRKLSFSVSQTMRVAQGLYEAGHITYMRTDSVNLSDLALGQAGEVIKREYGPEYHQVRKYKTKSGGAQEAHEAIRPTDFTAHSVSGDNNEKRLYDLIWKRTVASQMADAKTEKTTATVGLSNDPRVMVAQGEVLKFEGFLKVYLEGKDEEPDDEDGDSGVLPPMKIGQSLSLRLAEARQRFTHHPPRYTEASLVKKLEEEGIGRPSTYAPTISTIQKRQYVDKDNRDGVERKYRYLMLKNGKINAEDRSETTGAEKNKMFPSDLGIMVTDFLMEHFPKVLDYQFTAKVEQEFDTIATGELTWSDMIGSFYGGFKQRVDDTRENAERVNKDRLLGIDPKSNKEVWAKFGRYGPFVQIGEKPEDGDEKAEKPKYASLRKDQLLDTITLEDALELFKLPRVLGTREGVDVKVNVGRFGPYVQVGKVYASIPRGEEPLDITLERALEIYDAKALAEANKMIKEFNADVQVLNGRYGPYIKAHGVNVRIPKGQKAEELTLEECLKLYEEQKDKPKGRKGKK